MKKTLLLQTALVAAAGLFVADVANAQVKAQPLGVTVGGYFTQFYKVQDRDNNATTNQASQNFASDAEIWFNIRGVLDNGTVIGGRVELEAATYGDQIDERYMFLERADVGRVELGSTDRVSGKMLYFAPNSLPGHSTTVNSEYTAVSGGFANAPLMWFANANHDAEGINIYTAANRYFGSKAGKGLQLGFSYVPDGCQDFGTVAAAGAQNANCGAGFGTTTDAGQLSRQYVIAGNYLESFGPVDAALYSAWNSVVREATAQDRLNGWQVGTQFSWNLGGGSALQFGGGYSDEEISSAVGTVPATDRKAYSVGVRYLTNGAAPGSVGIGVEYQNREDKNTTTTGAFAAASTDTGNTELNYYHLGVTYQLATGVLTFAGVGVADMDKPGTVNDFDQTFGVVGIGLNF